MARLPLYQPIETTELADSLAFDEKASNDIWKLGSDHAWGEQIDGLSSLLKMPEPLPVVVSERPDAMQIRQTQATQQPAPTALPEIGSSQGADSRASTTPAQQEVAGMAPAASSGQPQAMPQASAIPQTGDLRAYTRAKAASLGIDPDVAERVFGEGEGGFDDPVRQSDVIYQGAREQSYGPAQLNMTGGLGSALLRDRGIDVRDPKNVYAGIDFALEDVARNGWGAFHGAARIGVGERQGIGQAPRSQGPSPAEQTPQAQRQAFSAGSYTPNQIEAATSEGLDYETALAVCGPAAAIAFARKNGRNPTMQEAVGLAREVGWTASSGMAGPASQQRLLQRMGVAARLEEGAPDWRSVAADVQRGNPVTISTPGHYFVAERYDPESGAFDFGESARVLKASGGKRWFRPEELSSLGMGEPRASLFIDNPESPTPSAVAGPSALNAGASPAPLPPGPRAGVGDPLIDAGPGAPDDLMLRGPLQPTPGDAFETDPAYTGRGTAPAGGGTRLPPAERPSVSSGVYDAQGAPGPSFETGEQPWPPSSAPIPTAEGQTSTGASRQGAFSDPTISDPAYISGPFQQGPTTDPLGPEMPQPAAIQAVQSARAEPEELAPKPPGLLPVWDASQRIIGYVQENARPAADAVVKAAEALPGPVGGIPNPISVARGIFENTEPAAGAPRKMARMREISDQAARDLGMTGARATLSTEAVRDPQWRAANPEIAAEYDTLDADVSLNVGLGTVGDAGRFGRAGEFVNDALPFRPSQTFGAPVPENVAPTAPLGEMIQRGREAAQEAGTRVSEGFQQGRRVAAELNAQPPGSPAYGTLGAVPDPEIRIPRAGSASDLSEGAEQMVRQASDANAPQEVVSRAEVARKAEELIGIDPEQGRAWQDAALAEAPDTRAVRGEVLRQAEYIDAENANRALERLRAAQQRAREAGDPSSLPAGERFDVADALLEAAETARAFDRSAAASTAEGRATARALGQRRSTILARSAYQTAQRARQVGQDASFAANAVQRASRTGTLDDSAAARLRTLRDKLADPDANGIGFDDGAGGRLETLEQRAVEAAAPPPPPRGRTAAARQGRGIGTTIATEAGQAILGAGSGVTAGLATGQIEDAEDVRNWAVGGAVAGFGLRAGVRAASRRAARGGTLATFGHVPTPDNPQRAVAMGSDPSRRYEFRYRVADLGELIPSNLPNGAPNPSFPRELQPRSRERAASQLQVDQIAQNLSPDALLNDFGRLDAGPMIVGADNIVESGNGRVLGLNRAAEQHPERYQAYIDALRRDLGDYGLSEADLAGKQRPVLVRERVTDVDRPAFAAEANGSTVLRMSPVERAAQSAGSLSDEVVTNLTVGENDTIAQALRRAENRDLVRQWLSGIPENERAELLDEAGNVSTQAYDALANALLVRTYGQGGVARAFVEAADLDARNVQVAIMGSLPDMARAEALIRSGQRDAGLSLAEDVAKATEVLTRLKQERISVGDYIRQVAMGDRELTPFQEQMLQFLDQNQRRPSAIRQTLREYASVVENAADPNQGDMFGGAVASVSKEDAWKSATSGATRERQARIAARQSQQDATNAARTPASEIVPSTGGPEGTLNVEGLPAVSGAADRPGPVGAVPAGGPEGTLRRSVVEDRSVPAGQAIAAPSGGPDGSLTPGTAAPIAELTQDARTWMQRAAKDTNNQALDQEFRSAVDALANHSPQGRKAALDLLARHDAAMSEQSTKLLGDVEKRLADDARRATQQQTREIEQSRIRGVVGMIDEVLANPRAPGAVERLQELQADLTEISQRGFNRASEIRARLQRNGLLRAGLASRTEDVDALVSALARVDPEHPEEMRAVLSIISKPRLIDRLLEYQYVNMLASPITQAVNISSNAMQIAGRLFLQNPLEFAYSGGRSGGVKAAVGGAVRGFREALPEAGQIMRTGVGRGDIDRALELGDYGHINREVLTEKYGKLGAALHVISTRPLQAMDALLGHTAYASAAEQYAQRKADDLLRKGAASVKGMTPEQARQHVLSNIWDYPEIVEQAGKIEDYTLLRSQDTEGQGWGRVERGLRQLAAVRNPAEDAGFAGQVTAFLTNQIMPFFNVPLNFAKQGAERTVGVPVNAVRAGRAYGHGDVELGAELAAKATIGASALATAGLLAYGDNLTGDGPSDSGRRAVWEQTHRRNSYRVPGTDQWLTWEGTPFAIPFGMVAGMREGAGEALERSAKKGQTDPVDVLGSAVLKTGQGAASAFLSQSFVRGLADQYKLLTGQDVSLSSQAASAASTVSRFLPASGMLNFMARVSDGIERDMGKPQTVSELPENIAGRVGSRIPGIRQQLDPKLDIYGEPTPNEQSGAAGALPYYRGAGPRAGDPITQRVEAAGVGAPQAPTEITFREMKIPLEMAEQRAFQQAWGRAFRRELEGMQRNGKEYPSEAYQKARDEARREAESTVLQQLGPAEIRRRVEGRQPVGVR